MSAQMNVDAPSAIKRKNSACMPDDQQGLSPRGLNGRRPERASADRLGPVRLAG